ncbi:3-hydroxyacyl-CoA dehydrogenase family protein [candidate division KSB1 bacterium]|nr:3-hydroxyacyl-CoA dehydrogenase family protein [candidate division KSB1 bacterium]
MKLDDIKNVTVLGTGMMGPGIALLFAKADYNIFVWGRHPEKGEQNLSRNIKDMINQNIISIEEAEKIHAKIQITSNFEKALERADFVSETILENLNLKREIFQKCEKVCPSHTILTSCTSTLMPSAISEGVKTKNRLLVAHFWNPAYLVPLVEVCGGCETHPEAIKITMQLLKRIGHKPVLLKKEILGFIGNRLMHALNREALALVQEGVVEPADIDKVVLTSFGPRFANIGPLEYLDFVGLDLVDSIQDYLYADLDRTKGKMPIIREKVKSGHLGVKQGIGLFNWSNRDPEDVRRRRDVEFLRRIQSSKKEK